MGKHLEEKSLITVNENSILYKIKTFFLRLFGKNNNIVNEPQITPIDNNNVQSNKRKDAFMESIRNVEDEETKLLKLQKQYRSGEIKEEELTQEQVSSLCALYDKQIANLRKSNEIRKQKLLEYRRKLQTDN